MNLRTLPLALAFALALASALAAARVEGAAGPASAGANPTGTPAATVTNAGLPPGHVRGPASVPGKDRSRVTEADRQWWAFQPLRNAPPPKVKNGSGTRNPVDQFIQAALDAKKLKLNAPADRRTLLRRASFDLLGLPPAPEEVDAFLRDTSADAWERVVERLLASPRYGERWARHWLDVARFAESSGFEHDYDRPNAYHYRDFVIKALNSDMPYDQFVRWQIAGDEFEPDNPLALMATGFLGAGVFPTQITANEVERTRYDAMDDMLATTGTAMLGLTIGCARCHDHKFDPIPTRDYYRMLATFTTTVRSDIELDLQPAETRRSREAYDREHAPLVAALGRYETNDLPARFDAWLEAGAPLPARPGWSLLDPASLKSKAGATFRKLDDGSHLVEGKNGDSDTYTLLAAMPPAGPSGWRALRLEALAHSSMPKGGPGRADNGNIGLSRIRLFTSRGAGGPTSEVKIARARATFEQNADHLSVSAALDGNPRSGWALDPKFGTNHAAVFEFAEPLSPTNASRFEVRLEFEVNTRHNIGRLRLALTDSEHPAVDGDAFPAAIQTLLASVRDGDAKSRALSSADRGTLLAWWKTMEPGWKSLNAAVEAHSRKAPKPKLTKVMICGEGYPAIRMHTQGADFFKETFFLNRGSTDQKRGVASPGYLQALLPAADESPEKRWSWEPPAGAKYSGRRRALALWLTDADRGAGHLLARVIANRVWQHHFGQGLVATPNDFGVQGARPSHPELLDWLAAELIRGGWRLKPLHQLILNSAAYRQSGDADAARLKADPGNALCSRQAPRRLEAEAIRDSLLFAAGVLDTNMFGPGTLDSSSRRRSIYFTIKRSQMISSMQAFDAPEPLVSQGARPSTTVAPQALLLMNSAQVRSWAQAFAARFTKDLGMDPGTPEGIAAGVTRAYQIALNRPPTRRELADATGFIASQRSRHAADQAAGPATDSQPVVGRAPNPDPLRQALTDFAQVVLSLNEFVYAE